MKRVFFLIPVYKVEEYLRRCVNSVLSQTYKNIEIILIDDGSPDGCPAICDEFAGIHENIHVIHKKNGGLSDARNAGLLYMLNIADDEDFLTFLDSDDFVDKEFTKKMVRMCEDHSCDIAQCGYEKGDKEHFSVKSVDTEPFWTSSYKALLGYDLKSQSCAKLYRVKLFKDILFPKGVWNEDEFTTYRVVSRAENIVFSHEALYYYFQHNSGIMNDISKKLKNNPHRHDFLKAYEDRIKFFIEKEQPEQVMKTHEKICTDIILRYCEQMSLKKDERDEDCVNGGYIHIYRTNFKLMIKRNGIPLKRRLMYLIFMIMPYSAVLMSKIFTIRK